MILLRSSLRLSRASSIACYRSLHLVKTKEFGFYKVAEDERKLQFLDPLKSFVERNFKLRPNVLKFIKSISSQRNMCDGESQDSSYFIRKYVPNDAARGIKKLDRSLFSCPIKVLGIAVPNNSVAQFRKVFKTSIVRLPNIKPVVSLSDSDPLHDTHRLVLLDSNSYKSAEDFISMFSEQLSKLSVKGDLCKFYDMELDYNNWNYDEVLKWILPREFESVGGFSTIGHIAHLNLKDELLEFKEVIGEVILDKVGCIKTVVNKLHTIDNTFRNFKMEVLAGEENFITTAKEHGFAYELDFSKIYWNSRLSMEHQRITTLVSPKDVLFDVFAGVGPFSIPCAKKGCRVYANDLNPHSVYWLKKNLKLNKVHEDKVNVSNLDGRDFIRDVVRPELLKMMSTAVYEETPPEDQLIHIPMNLPALAVEFLDAFPGLLSEVDHSAGDSTSTVSTQEESAKVILNDGEDLSQRDTTVTKPPQQVDRSGLSNVIVHCYCFSKEEDPENDAIQRVKDVLHLDSLTFHDSGVKRVRNVAPSKEMLCVSVRLPWELLLRKPAEKRDHDGGELEPEPKRMKL